MPGEFRDELDPRSAIPFSDAEIRELYRRAAAEDPGLVHTDTPERRQDLRQAWTWDVALWVLVSLTPLFQSPRAAILSLLLLPLAVLAYVLGEAALRRGVAIGPFSYVALRKWAPRPASELDPNDVGVLATVVDFIASQPLRYADDLGRKIERDRHAIAASIGELDLIEATLRDELRGTEEPSLRLLVESKREAAMRALERLRELDALLAGQQREAQEAVRPVREMKLRFERLRRLSTSLSRIHAAHGLIESSEERLMEHRLELQTLRTVSQDAVARLHEIQRMVEAQEHARLELGYDV